MAYLAFPGTVSCQVFKDDIEALLKVLLTHAARTPTITKT